MKEASKVLLLLLKHQDLPQTETSKVLITKVSLQAHRKNPSVAIKSLAP